MSGALCGDDNVFTVTIEYGLFLPVFQYLELSGNKLQLFLDLSEEGLGCPFLFLVGQGEVDLYP